MNEFKNELDKKIGFDGRNYRIGRNYWMWL